MRTIEYKTLALTGAKASGDIISGYASTFGPPEDSYGDIIEPGAFSADIAENGSVRPALWSHDMTELIGTCKVEEDGKGLRAEFSLVPAVQRAAEALALIKAGALTGISIGYIPANAYFKGTTRFLTEIELLECSLVTLPANDRARLDDEKALRAISEALANRTTAIALENAFATIRQDMKGRIAS